MDNMAEHNNDEGALPSMEPTQLHADLSQAQVLEVLMEDRRATLNQVISGIGCLRMDDNEKKEVVAALESMAADPLQDVNDILREHAENQIDLSKTKEAVRVLCGLEDGSEREESADSNNNVNDDNGRPSDLSEEGDDEETNGEELDTAGNETTGWRQQQATDGLREKAIEKNDKMRARAIERVGSMNLSKAEKSPFIERVQSTHKDFKPENVPGNGVSKYEQRYGAILREATAVSSGNPYSETRNESSSSNNMDREEGDHGGTEDTLPSPPRVRRVHPAGSSAQGDQENEGVLPSPLRVRRVHAEGSSHPTIHTSEIGSERKTQPKSASKSQGILRRMQASTAKAEALSAKLAQDRGLARPSGLQLPSSRRTQRLAPSSVSRTPSLQRKALFSASRTIRSTPGNRAAARTDEVPDFIHTQGVATATDEGQVMSLEERTPSPRRANQLRQRNSVRSASRIMRSTPSATAAASLNEPRSQDTPHEEGTTTSTYTPVPANAFTRTASQSHARPPAVYQRNTPSARQRETLTTTTRSLTTPKPSDGSFYGLDQHELQLLNETEIADFEEKVVRIQQAEDAERDRIRSESYETVFRVHQASLHNLHEADEQLEQELHERAERRTALALKLQHMKATARTSQEQPGSVLPPTPRNQHIGATHSPFIVRDQSIDPIPIGTPGFSGTPSQASRGGLDFELSPDGSEWGSQRKAAAAPPTAVNRASSENATEKSICASIGCDNTNPRLQCPRCAKIGRMTFVCSQECYDEKHKLTHMTQVEVETVLSDEEASSDEDGAMNGIDVAHGVGLETSTDRGAGMLSDAEYESVGLSGGLVIGVADDADVETSTHRFAGAAGSMEGGPTKATAESVEGVPEKPSGKCGKKGCYGTNRFGEPCGQFPSKIAGANPWYCSSHQP